MKEPKKNKLKCYVLMIAREFLATHPLKGKETGFKDKILKGVKIHTIRKFKNNKRWEKIEKEVNEGRAYLSLREWTGKPYRTKQVEIVKLYKIKLQIINLHYDVYFDCISCHEEFDISEVWKNDGLNIWEFIHWFFPKYEPMKQRFKGIIIHFTDLRY